MCNIFCKETINVATPGLLSKPLVKMVYYKKKEFVHKRSKYFSFKVGLFSEERQSNCDRDTASEIECKCNLLLHKR